MATSEPWWTSREIIGTLLGVVVGFLLSSTLEWWRGRRRRRAHWAALNAEMKHCRELAEIYLRNKAPAPLYRLPTVAYVNSLPALLESAALNESDTQKLLSFFNEVETLNRGLDQAEGASLIADCTERNKKLDQEFNRNRLKAERLVSLNDCSPSYYDRAKSVVKSKLKWSRL